MGPGPGPGPVSVPFTHPEAPDNHRVVMSGAAFNVNRLPSIVPWKGWTWRWFDAMINDDRMMVAFGNTLVVAVAVAILSVIVGTASAILLNSISGRVRTLPYSICLLSTYYDAAEQKPFKSIGQLEYPTKS